MVATGRFGSVSEYIASKPKEARVVLERVRWAIRKAVPAAEEGLSYQIPVYKLNGVAVLYFAGWKAHYSLYPASDALVEAFASELAPYKRSKGTIRMPFSEPVPEGLIGRIARFRAKQITTREKGRAARFKPPYVGAGGWIGVSLDQIKDDELRIHLRQAWELTARKMRRRPRTSE